MPGFDQRLRLWEDNLTNKPYHLAAGVDLRSLASDYELSGGSIINVLRYACLKAIVRPRPEIQMQDLLNGVRKESHKEGKFLKQRN
jgi:ATP-dependent 26S proteasome regulatory subunit